MRPTRFGVEVCAKAYPGKADSARAALECFRKARRFMRTKLLSPLRVVVTPLSNIVAALAVSSGYVETTRATGCCRRADWRRIRGRSRPTCCGADETGTRLPGEAGAVHRRSPH